MNLRMRSLDLPFPSRMKQCGWIAIAVGASLLLSVRANAQSDTIRSNRTITNVQMVGLGYTNILDTYLSPEEYTGEEIRYISHTTREKKDSHLSLQIVHCGNMAYTNNRAGKGGEISGLYTFEYGYHYNWQFLGGKLQLKAGAVVDANLGFIYNTRNGNNPFQARVSLNILPSGTASYRFHIRQVPIAVGYELGIPLLGVMFSPNYGQSYYEIFSQGNYDHNAVITTPNRAPSLRQMLTFDITFGKSTWRVGYLGDYDQAKVNSLKRHVYSHVLLIGFVRHFQILKIRP